MDSSYVLFLVLLFVAVALSLEGGYKVWASKNRAEAKRVASRLRPLDETPLTIERHIEVRRWNWLDDSAFAGLPGGPTLLRYLETSGTGRGAGEMLLYSAVLGVVGAAVPAVLAKPWTFSVVLGGIL